MTVMPSCTAMWQPQVRSFDWHLFLQSSCSGCSRVVALFIHDSIITFDREVACFWTAKWTGASILFLANKWLSITNCVMELYDYAPIFSNEVSRYESFHT